MKYLLALGFSLTFVGASCGDPTPLTRSCPGAPAQTARYLAQGECGAQGIITVSVPNAGQCAIAVVEPTSVGLPTSGMLNQVASETGYQLAKGNWNLQPVPTGTYGANCGLYCKSGAATAAGDITLTCNITECEYIGEDLEPTAVPAGVCVVHLTPAVGDASLPSADAGASDASRDATSAQ